MKNSNRTIAALAAALLAVHAGPVHAGSRVIVSTTLNSTLEFFDATTLEELQPPFPSRGGGPVRLWVATIGGKPLLFSANHGAPVGSVGVFDLSLTAVVELPLSPTPSRAGSVGVVAGDVQFGLERVPMAFVTNTYFALGGCSMPNGSVTAYDARLAATTGALLEIGTVELTQPIPWGVSLSGADARAFASTNCGGKLETIRISNDGPFAYYGAPGAAGFRVQRIEPTRDAAPGSDGTVFDSAYGLNYTLNINGGSVSVHDATSTGVRTTVPLKKADGSSAGPIDGNLADSRQSGRRWLVTSNGSDDSVSLIDRPTIAACADAGQPVCAAEVLRVKTKVPGGAPESVDYDPVTNRIFAVNKNILSPSLSVIQLSEAGGSLSGEDIQRIPLRAVAGAVPVPAIIAFDVVVQVRE